MKSRLDFVTNSSSSSFVVAFKEETTREDIKNIILSNDKHWKSYLADWEVEDHEVDAILEEIIYSIYSCKENGLKLDSWIVSATTESSDDGPEYGYLYDIGYIDTPLFKASRA